MNPIIVPVVNNPSGTHRCLLSCFSQDLPDVGVIAIDNASQCGATLRSFPVLYWYRTRRSLHAIWNEALSWCFDKMKYPQALVINNDVWLRPDLYRLLLEDGGPFVTGVSVGKFKDTESFNAKSKSPHPSFSCFMIRREVWDEVGKFDENLWAYCGDGDYHLRLDQKGIDAYALAVPFYHEVSGTMKHADPKERMEIQKLADKDRDTFKRKWGFAVGSKEYYESFRKAVPNIYAETGRLDGSASPDVPIANTGKD